MTGKQLRNSILQWAIQGKLVPQDPNDEPASVLLERIREEKARLVKEKKIKRDKNETIIYRGEDNSYYEKTLATGSVKCIDDEIPFEIPQGWEWCRIGDYTQCVTDFVASGSFAALKTNVKYYDTDEYALLVRTKDFRHNFTRDLVYTDIHGYNFLENSNLYGGEIILPNIGASIGKVFIVPHLNRPMTLAPNSVMVRFTEEDLKWWFFSLFESPIGISFLKEISNSTAQGKFNKTDFKKIIIPIPPLNEQYRIIRKLEELKNPLSTIDINLENLRTLNISMGTLLQQSILQEAIQGRLVPQIESEGTANELLEEIRAEKQRLVKEGKLKKSALASESRIFRADDNKYYEQVGSITKEISEVIPFDIPASWRWCRIESIFQINPKNYAEDNTEVAFVPMEAINPGYGSCFTFQLTKWKNIKRGYTHFADGDIAFAKITPCFQNRKSVIFHNLPSGIGAGTTELKVLRPMVSQISPEYILAFLQSSYFIDEATFKGTANQQRIISGYVENKLFPLPPIEEQRRIALRLQELLELTL